MKFMQKQILIIFTLLLATPQVAPFTLTPRTQYLGAGAGISLFATLGVMYNNYQAACKKEDSKISNAGFLNFCSTFVTTPSLLKKHPKTAFLLALNGSLITATSIQAFIDSKKEIELEKNENPAPVVNNNPAARIEAARVEAARVEAARVEAARVEAARVEAARVEAARVKAAEAKQKRLEAFQLLRFRENELAVINFTDEELALIDLEKTIEDKAKKAYTLFDAKAQKAINDLREITKLLKADKLNPDELARRQPEFEKIANIKNNFVQIRINAAFDGTMLKYRTIELEDLESENKND